jgi:hypothetical protein
MQRQPNFIIVSEFNYTVLNQPGQTATLHLQTCIAIIATTQSGLVFVAHQMAGLELTAQWQGKTGETIQAALENFARNNRIQSVALIGGDHSYPSNIARKSAIDYFKQQGITPNTIITNESTLNIKLLSFALANPLPTVGLIFILIFSAILISYSWIYNKSLSATTITEPVVSAIVTIILAAIIYVAVHDSKIIHAKLKKDEEQNQSRTDLTVTNDAHVTKINLRLFDSNNKHTEDRNFNLTSLHT